jgi:hypothetical protein
MNFWTDEDGHRDNGYYETDNTEMADFTLVGGEGLHYRNHILKTIYHIPGDNCVCRLLDPEVRKMCTALGYNHDDIKSTKLEFSYHDPIQAKSCFACSVMMVTRCLDGIIITDAMVLDTDGDHRFKNPIQTDRNSRPIIGPMYQYDAVWMNVGFGK